MDVDDEDEDDEDDGDDGEEDDELGADGENVRRLPCLRDGNNVNVL